MQARAHAQPQSFHSPGRAALRLVRVGARSCTVARVAAVPTPELEEERLLCERACGGDREALGALLRRHGPRLYRSALLPRLGSAAAAEEALSSVYLRVVEKIAQFTWQEVGFYPWLRVVALRVALDQIRSKKREVLFDSADIERELDSSAREERDAAALENHDLLLARQRVSQLLDRINPRYAQAIRLRILEERSREEAAAALEVSVATFDVVLHRATAALRKALSLSAEAHD